MKTIFALIFVLFLSACSTGDTPLTEIKEIKIQCIDGVKYIVFREGAGYSGYGYLSVKFNRDGTVETCN